MKSEPGTYALILRSRRHIDIEVGRRQSLSVRPACYVYVGSAFGPGGIRARVARHFREAKGYHWHIDYLRAVTEPVCAWCSFAPERLEHIWARSLAESAAAACVRGFGCSDCDCDGHLFVMARVPTRARALGLFGEPIERYVFEAGA